MKFLRRLFRRKSKHYPVVTAIAADNIRVGQLVIIQSGRAFVVPAEKLLQPPNGK